MLITVFIIIIINGIWSTCNTLGMRATPCWKHNSFTLYLNVVNAQFTMSTIYIFVYWNNVNMFQSTSHCVGHNIQVPVQLGHNNVSFIWSHGVWMNRYGYCFNTYRQWSRIWLPQLRTFSVFHSLQINQKKSTKAHKKTHA